MAIDTGEQINRYVIRAWYPPEVVSECYDVVVMDGSTFGKSIETFGTQEKAKAFITTLANVENVVR